jgi:hypothetical protein
LAEHITRVQIRSQFGWNWTRFGKTRHNLGKADLSLGDNWTQLQVSHLSKTGYGLDETDTVGWQLTTSVTWLLLSKNKMNFLFREEANGRRDCSVSMCSIVGCSVDYVGRLFIIWRTIRVQENGTETLVLTEWQHGDTKTHASFGHEIRRKTIKLKCLGQAQTDQAVSVCWHKGCTKGQRMYATTLVLRHPVNGGCAITSPVGVSVC